MPHGGDAESGVEALGGQILQDAGPNAKEQAVDELRVFSAMGRSSAGSVKTP